MIEIINKGDGYYDLSSIPGQPTQEVFIGTSSRALKANLKKILGNRPYSVKTDVAAIWDAGRNI
jgi:hypothetical protein